MNRRLVVDSGPLIALFDKSDRYCAAAQDFVRGTHDAMFTTMPVVTEVEYLLDFSVGAQGDFLEWIFRGGLSVVDFEKNDFLRMKELMEKYRDLPMDFADGSVVAACEKLDTPCVATLDRDFEIYRFRDRKKFVNAFAA